MTEPRHIALPLKQHCRRVKDVPRMVALSHARLSGRRFTELARDFAISVERARQIFKQSLKVRDGVFGGDGAMNCVPEWAFLETELCRDEEYLFDLEGIYGVLV